MPNLRLRRDEETDVIPFPTQGTGWYPRPLFERTERPKHDAEKALDQVELHLNRLSGILDNGDDDDRPSAA